MDLKYTNSVNDKRGSIVFVNYGKKQINIVEIKKGYARGGHYHDFATKHILIHGTIEYKETNPKTKKELVKKYKAPSTISVPARAAHLLTAIENAIFIEVFDKGYSATNYQKYRNIVEEKMYGPS
jgi:hypothetical protein